ncbi:hypothetical protein RI543_002919 [Arxiozyma heterogenica]|uniref:Uncharacterized protein n=1 Tax=Arxiozyma heterogenica TaxID=278026 RepID=A0AAN7W2K9_9SACH|nr:hypothetical protein RI543_002919 [Kazachstania heterogenica]
MALFTKIFLRCFTLLFLAGNTLLLILIILSGSMTNYPIDRLYWIQGDTSGIPNAANTTRWTFWGACSISNGITECGEHLSPAAPISPLDNFDTKVNVPFKFISDRDTYYYLSRFSFCFFWIALAFIGVAFLLYILTFCSRFILQVVMILSIVGCIFNMVAVVLQTAVSVLARNAFHDADRKANVGAPLLGIAWASLVVAFIDMCLTICWWWKAKKNNSYNSPLINDDPEIGGFFHRKKDSLPVPEPLEPYSVLSPSPVPANPSYNNDNNLNVPYLEENANQEQLIPSASPALTASIQLPTPNQGSIEQNPHKGIKFFTVRKHKQHMKDDASEDDSV